MFEAIDRYKEYLKRKGNLPPSIETTLFRLRGYFADDTLPLADLTTRRMQSIYQRRTKEVAVDTHRNEHAEVKTFLNWCIKQGFIKRNRAGEVVLEGRRRKGKPQYRGGQAKVFRDGALAKSAEGSDGAFATVCCLDYGFRQADITRRRVGDVDPHTRWLHVEDAKTEAGNLVFEISEELWPHFAARIEGRDPSEPLLPARSADGFHRKEWVTDNAKRIARELGLPDSVGSHGLRGTNKTLAVRAGKPLELVSKEAGHTTTRVTRECYVAPGTIEHVNNTRVHDVLTSEPLGKIENKPFPKHDKGDLREGNPQ